MSKANARSNIKAHVPFGGVSKILFSSSGLSSLISDPPQCVRRVRRTKFMFPACPGLRGLDKEVSIWKLRHFADDMKNIKFFLKYPGLGIWTTHSLFQYEMSLKEGRISNMK
jgi:hypothetical protein